MQKIVGSFALVLQRVLQSVFPNARSGNKWPQHAICQPVARLKMLFFLFSFCQIHIKLFSLLSCFLHLPQTDLLSYFVEFSLHRSSSSPCLRHPTAESLACFHQHQTLPQAIVLHPFVGFFKKKFFRATSRARNPSVLEKKCIFTVRMLLQSCKLMKYGADPRWKH